jgi:murein L,D-transpeptidase YafK
MNTRVGVQAALLVCLLLAGRPAAAEPPWLLIDSARNTLAVMEDGQVLQEFRGIAVGRGGVAASRYRGDSRTPRGEFHIAWINPTSPYHLFFGLDYPAAAQAEAAYRDRRIDADTYERIRRAHETGELPPQDTALGGYIGIHGVGALNAGVNPPYNWTQGCVALSDDDIDRLARWAAIGTRVLIR